MSLDEMRPPDGRDVEITRLLRETYRAPADDGYWESLEQRFVARVRDAGARASGVASGVAADAGEWWQAFSGWVRAGLVAAGIAMVAAGMAMMRTRAAEARVAYEEVLETPAPLTAPVPGDPERDATLQYVISH